MPAEQPSVRGNNIKPAEVQPQDILDLPSYSSDSDAPAGSAFWHTGSDEIRYKDDVGSVYTSSGGLSDGDNFDGQGTSDFTNLNSVSTEQIDSKDGYGSDLSGSRSFNTWYQNTTGGDLTVQMTFQFNNAGPARTSAKGHVSSSQSDKRVFDWQNEDGEKFDKETVTLFVPDQYYYKVRNRENNLQLLSWFEQT